MIVDPSAPEPVGKNRNIWMMLGEASKAQKERLEAELKGAEAAKTDVEKELVIHESFATHTQTHTFIHLIILLALTCRPWYA